MTELDPPADGATTTMSLGGLAPASPSMTSGGLPAPRRGDGRPGEASHLSGCRTRCRQDVCHVERRLAGGEAGPERCWSSLGAQVGAEDRPLLGAFVAQLRQAQDQQRLADTAASAESLAKANELRTALLNAVSHDLRTPLASIKASATSLLSDDIDWPADTARSFYETIDAETDRLANLVANLLDMSRLQTGVVHPAVVSVGLDEIVFAAMASLCGDTSTIDVDVPEALPPALTDPALLERALANLIANARAWTPTGVPVRVEAGVGGPRLDIRIVDRGPGIPEDRRDAVFEPFQRLGDQTTETDNGVGLGLAVARGFSEALGGEVALEDTPGGGLTAIISVPIAETHTPERDQHPAGSARPSPAADDQTARA